MERGAGTASSAFADNAVLFFHKAVLFRAFFENSIMTHVRSASTDICARPGLFSPWSILYPPWNLQPQSVPHAHYFTRAICSPVPTQFLSVCPCSSQKSPSAPGAAAFHGFWGGLWRQPGWWGLHTLHELHPPLWITRASAPDDTKSWLNAHFCSRKCVIHQHNSVGPQCKEVRKHLSINASQVKNLPISSAKQHLTHIF